LLGQVGVALGWVSSVADPAVSHMAAGVLLIITASGIVVAGSAVAERERAQRTLERAEARLRALLDSSQDVLTVSDASGELTYVSPAAVRGLGREPEALVGTPLLDLVDAEHRARVEEELASVACSGQGARTSIDVLVELASHERRWFAWSAHNLLDDPLVAGLVVVQSDITDRLHHQEELAHAASHDDLTGLPNRSDLLARIEEAGAEAVAGAGLAVLFLDLDRFKEVNDLHGHPAGDELLITIARRLRAALRPHDHLARISGDEFCAVLTEVRDAAEVDGVVDRLRDVVSRPIALRSGVQVRVDVSVGRALAFEPRSAEELLTAADTAMYRDKRARRRPFSSRPVTSRLTGPRDSASGAPAAGTTPA
uniref:diguanylate cyclase domain-containing protein n=1 Tax=Actinotalea sp. TaxID=1872145 RepID=UPI0035670B4A